jgi:hypothetical protein
VAIRDYRDSEGVTWRVWYVEPGSIAGRAVESLPNEYQGGWLCFASDREKRRLCPAPSSWESLSDGELDVLRHTAGPVKPAQ